MERSFCVVLLLWNNLSAASTKIQHKSDGTLSKADDRHPTAIQHKVSPSMRITINVYGQCNVTTDPLQLSAKKA